MKGLVAVRQRGTGVGQKSKVDSIRTATKKVKTPSASATISTRE